MSAKIMPRGWMDKDEPRFDRPNMWRFIYFSFGWALIGLVTFLMLWGSDGMSSRLRAIFYCVGLAPGAILIGLIVYFRITEKPRPFTRRKIDCKIDRPVIH